MSEAAHVDVTNGDAYVGNPDAIADAQNERTGQNTVIKMGLGAVGLAAALHTGIPQNIAHAGVDAANSGKEMVANFAGHKREQSDPSSDVEFRRDPEEIVIGTAGVLASPKSILLDNNGKPLSWEDARFARQEIMSDGKPKYVLVEGVEYGMTVKLGNPGIIHEKNAQGEDERYLQIPRLDTKGELTYALAPLGADNSQFANVIASFETIKAVGSDDASGSSHTTEYTKMPPAQISVVSVEPTQ